MTWFDAGVNMFDARMPVEQTIENALEIYPAVFFMISVLQKIIVKYMETLF